MKLCNYLFLILQRKKHLNSYLPNTCYLGTRLLLDGARFSEQPMGSHPKIERLFLYIVVVSF